MYAIDLTKFNPDLFYDKIVELVSKNLGWVNFQKAIFENVEERDYCLLELEKQLGIKGSEIKEFEGDAKALYIALKQIYPNEKLSKAQEIELNKSFIELLMINSDETFHLLKDSKEKLSNFKKIRDYEKLEVINELQQVPKEYKN